MYVDKVKMSRNKMIFNNVSYEVGSTMSPEMVQNLKFLDQCLLNAKDAIKEANEMKDLYDTEISKLKKNLRSKKKELKSVTSKYEEMAAEFKKKEFLHSQYVDNMEKEKAQTTQQLASLAEYDNLLVQTIDRYHEVSKEHKALIEELNVVKKAKDEKKAMWISSKSDYEMTEFVNSETTLLNDITKLNEKYLNLKKQLNDYPLIKSTLFENFKSTTLVNNFTTQHHKSLINFINIYTEWMCGHNPLTIEHSVTEDEFKLEPSSSLHHNEEIVCDESSDDDSVSDSVSSVLSDYDESAGLVNKLLVIDEIDM